MFPNVQRFLGFFFNLLISLMIVYATLNYFFSGLGASNSDYFAMIPLQLPFILILILILATSQTAFCLLWLGSANNNPLASIWGRINLLSVLFIFGCAFFFAQSPELVSGILLAVLLSSLIIAAIKLRVGYPVFSEKKFKAPSKKDYFVSILVALMMAAIFTVSLLGLLVSRRVAAQFMQADSASHLVINPCGILDEQA